MKLKTKNLFIACLLSVVVSLEMKRGTIMKIFVLFGLVLVMVVGGCPSVSTQQPAQEELTKVLLVRRTEDFIISGRGDASAWMKTNWERLDLRKPDGHQ